MGEGWSECPICKEEFNVDEELIVIPCRHTFHKVCIVPWLTQVISTEFVLSDYL